MQTRLAQFSDDSTVCRCVIGFRGDGRRQWGTVWQLIQSGRGEDSTFGSVDGRVVDYGVRRSRLFRAVVNLQFERSRFRQIILPMVAPEERDGIIIPYGAGEYEIIEYLGGGHFSQHRDGLRSYYHYATMLIFPPAIGEFAHEGGELVITFDDGHEFVFESARNYTWTYVIFDPKLLHECRPVISGRRIVLKRDLHLDTLADFPPLQAADDMYNYIVD